MNFSTYVSKKVINFGTVSKFSPNKLCYRNNSLMKNDAYVSEKLSKLMQQYEDFVGLTEVKLAQEKVLEAEAKFTETQVLRRERQFQIQAIQLQLKEIHSELDKTSRGEDRFLQLLTREHAVIKDETKLLDELKFYEKEERDDFSALSTTVRKSHEKERSQAEKTKYWSVIGSVCGAVIGIIGTTINNRLRMRELRNLVDKSSDQSKIYEIIDRLTSSIDFQRNQIQKFIGDIQQVGIGTNITSSTSEKTQSSTVSNFLNDDLEKINNQSDNILRTIKQQENELLQELHNVKAIVSSNLVSVDNEDGKPVSVYVGENFPQLLQDTEQNLEWKMKINTIVTVAGIYAAVVIVTPLVYFFFKG